MIYPVYRAPRFASTADKLAAIAAATDSGELQRLWSRDLVRTQRVAAAYSERKATLARLEAEACAARGSEGIWG